jgi:adenine-specific DNA-methyltransferase
MSKTYKGSLSLEWYNKQKSILLQSDNSSKYNSDIPAPLMNWINKDEALFYEINESDGKGVTPYWVDRNDIRVKEARPLIFQKTFNAVSVDKPGTIPGTSIEWQVQEKIEDDSNIDNMLIKGDNLLALNTLKKIFDNKPEDEKIKCIYIDPPYNTSSAFDHYDDSLEHSKWLSMMRDRLIILRDLLQESGTIFISIDNNESCYLQVLMDEIFGRQNRKNIITLKRGSVTGAKVINPGLVNISEFILVYCKNSEYWSPNRIFMKKDRDVRYNSYIINIEDDVSNWKYGSVLEAFANYHNVPKGKLKAYLGEKFEKSLDSFIYENSEKVIQFATLDSNSISKEANKLKEKSENDSSCTYILERENGKRPYYVYRGKLILFAKDRLSNIDGEYTFSEPVTDIWLDVLPNDLHNEGDVEFRKGKKSEKLIQRLFEFTTNEDDFVLDCFGGSGSTFAVAIKMKRKWIGIEIGMHADTHIIKRLSSVLDGTDQSGISKALKWIGGGSYKYYLLGPSIIEIKENGQSDFNWSLSKKFIEESFLSSYDYNLITDFDFSDKELFTNKENLPSIGIQKFGTKSRVAIIILNPPNSKHSMLSFDELIHLYTNVKKRFSPEYINVFTNMGIELAYDSKPDDLEVIKVPHAIFAELEK